MTSIRSSLKVATVLGLASLYGGVAVVGCIGAEPTVTSHDGGDDGTTGGGSSSGGSSGASSSGSSSGASSSGGGSSGASSSSSSSSSGSGGGSSSGSGSSGGGSSGGSDPCAVDAGAGAIGILGCPCSQSGAKACYGNAATEALICANSGGKLVWQGNGSCSPGMLCDTSAGSTQGTCLSVAWGCGDATPGVNICLPEAAPPYVVQCGIDLVNTTLVQACGDAGQGCVSGACTTCRPGMSSCAGTYSIQTCQPNGTWGAASSCPGSNYCQWGGPSGAMCASGG